MKRLPLIVALLVASCAPLSAQTAPDPFAWIPRATVAEALATPSGAAFIDRVVQRFASLARPGCGVPPPSRAVVLDWMTRHGAAVVERNDVGGRAEAVQQLDAREGPDASRRVASLATHAALPEFQRIYRPIRLSSLVDMVAETFDRWVVLARVQGWRSVSAISTGDDGDLRNEMSERFDADIAALVQRRGDPDLERTFNAAAVLEALLAGQAADGQRRVFDAIAAPLREACILVD